MRRRGPDASSGGGWPLLRAAMEPSRQQPATPVPRRTNDVGSGTGLAAGITPVRMLIGATNAVLMNVEGSTVRPRTSPSDSRPPFPIPLWMVNSTAIKRAVVEGAEVDDRRNSQRERARRGFERRTRSARIKRPCMSRAPCPGRSRGPCTNPIGSIGITNVVNARTSSVSIGGGGSARACRS